MLLGVVLQYFNKNLYKVGDSTSHCHFQPYTNQPGNKTILFHKKHFMKEYFLNAFLTIVLI